MPAALLQIIVLVVELAAKFGPGLLEVGENLVKAIESHGELSDDERAALIARVRATRAAVAAYKARPKPEGATHRCKVCGALWRLWPVDPESNTPLGQLRWTLVSPKCGPCCDNVAMGDQIEMLPEPAPTPKAR